MATTLAVATDETAEAAMIVERFLVASMVPDPQTAALYISETSRSPSPADGSTATRARPRRSTASATNG